MKKKRHSPNLDAARQKVAEMRSELEAYKTALGLSGSPHLARLLVEYGRLTDAADPTPSVALDGTGRSRSQFGQPEPGAATRAHRGAKKGIDKAIDRLADRIATSLDDPTWRPPRGDKCPSCNLTSRYPGAKHCDACGTGLVTVE